MKVAVIGLGNMGFPIAERMLKASHEIIVYNWTQAKVEPLVALGTKRAETPAEAARESEAVSACWQMMMRLNKSFMGIMVY